MDPLNIDITSFLDRLKQRFEGASQSDRKKWVAYGALLLISLVLFISLGGSRRKYPDTATTSDGGVTSAEMFGDLSEKLTRIGGQDLSYAGGEITMEDINPVHRTWGRDPFASLREDQDILRDTGDHDLSLSAISWRGGEAVVLINDSVLREGETVNGAEVAEIHTSSVILERNGKRITLRLKGDS